VLTIILFDCYLMVNNDNIKTTHRCGLPIKRCRTKLSSALHIAAAETYTEIDRPLPIVSENEEK